MSIAEIINHDREVRLTVSDRWVGLGLASVRLMLAGVGGAVLIWLGVWLHERIDLGANAPDIILTDAALQLVSGQGERTPQGLLIHPSEAETAATVTAAVSGLSADSYRLITWEAEGLAPDQAPSLIWTSKTRRGATLKHQLSTEELAAGKADLGDKAGWEGEILGIGLILNGVRREPISIRSLTLRAAPPTLTETLAELTHAWRHLQPWSGQSINFHASAPAAARLTPVAMIAIWIGTTFLLAAVIPPHPTRRAQAGIAIILILAGWLTLDVRWQWELWERLSTTRDRYAGLTFEERMRAAPDAKLIELIQDIREQLPSEPARVLILSANPQGALSNRVRYHLMPHRVHIGLSGLPKARQVVPGDYILVLLPLKEIGFDRTRNRLIGPSAELPARLVHSVRRFGSLYQITEGS